jgi:hypothetical protein
MVSETDADVFDVLVVGVLVENDVEVTVSEQDVGI